MRFARDSEKVMALDGEEYELDDTITVIADENGVEGIAGIMGGEVTGVTEEPQTFFLRLGIRPCSHRHIRPKTGHHVGCTLPFRAGG